MKNKNLILSFLIFFLICFIAKSEIPIYEIKGKKITYTNNNFIIAEDDAVAENSNSQKILSNKIIYDKKKQIINTESYSIYFDKKGNKLEADKFNYDLKFKIIQADGNVKFTDNFGNIFNFSNLKYNVDSENGFGKDLKAFLNDKSTSEGRYGEFDNKSKTIVIGKNNKNFLENILGFFSKKNDNFYTTCEKQQNSSKSIEEFCPDWSITTLQTKHDQIKKMVYHENAIVRIKNIPVFYTPYFSHPDPSVKRKTGLLYPSIKNFTNLGQTAKLPYFWAIDDNSDLTFTPIYYFNENSIFLLEYNKQNEKSRYFIDTSYSQGYKNINKIDDNGNSLERTGGSRNHFFFNFLGSYDDLLFAKNDFEANIQRISQKNYLNVNQINTSYVKQGVYSLNNNLILNSYEDNKKIKIQANIYENLNVDDPSEKYQYTLPSINYNNYFNKFDQNINFNSNFSSNNFGSNKNQLYFVNQINSDSEIFFSKYLSGIGNIFKTSISNISAQNQNITGAKENFNSDTYFTVALDSSYPMIRYLKKNTEETLEPRIFTKFTSGSMTDESGDSKLLSFGDIYSMNRMNNITNPETGASLGYGLEYNFKKNSEDAVDNINGRFSIGQVLNKNKIKEMPLSSSLQEKKSNFVGNVNLTIGEKIDQIYNKNQKINSDHKSYSLDYSYNISNDLGKILKNELSLGYESSTNTFQATYYEAHDIGNDQYISADYKYNFYDNYNFSLSGKKNLENSFTENINAGVNYETDCIMIGLNFSKSFYLNDDVKPAASLQLTFILKPFGSPASPDLSNFVN